MTDSGREAARERDRLHEHLRNLSAILPVFAQERSEPQLSATALGVPLRGATEPALNGERHGDRGTAVGA